MNTSAELPTNKPRRRTWRSRVLPLVSIILVVTLGFIAFNTTLANRYLQEKLQSSRYQSFDEAQSVKANPALAQPANYQVQVPRQVTTYKAEGGVLKPITTTVYENQNRQQFGTPVDPAQQLAAQLRTVPAEQRSQEQMNQLQELLSQQFDRRHREQVARLQRVLEETKRTEEILARRETQKDQIVERRKTELLGGRDPLNWDYESTRAIDGSTGLVNPLAAPPATYPGNPRDSILQPFSSAIPSEPRRNFPNPTNATQGQFSQPSLPESENRSEVAPLPPMRKVEQSNSSLNEDILSATWPPSNNASTGGVIPSDANTSAAVTRDSRAGSASDLVNAGFRLRAAIREAEQAGELYVRGALSFPELNRLTDAQEEAETVWKFQTLGLESKLEVRALELEAAKEARSLAQGSAEKSEGIKLLRVAELEFEQLAEQLRWVNEFRQVIAAQKSGLKVATDVPTAEAPTEEKFLPPADLPAAVIPTGDELLPPELPPAKPRPQIPGPD